MSELRKIALVGNPNCGKTSLFNALTGLRQKVGNFPGVTVERKKGSFRLAKTGKVELVDLPGTYGLYPKAEDERVATQVLLNELHPDHPDQVIVVAEATNLRRSLLICTQVLDLGLPTVLALNMIDLVEAEGMRIDAAALAQLLGIPVVAISARQGTGLDDLRTALDQAPTKSQHNFFSIPASFDAALGQVRNLDSPASRYRAWQALMHPESFPDADQAHLATLRQQANVTDPTGLIANEITVRYDRIQGMLDQVQQEKPSRSARFSAALDRVLMHQVGGYVIFLGILVLIFQAIFAWATYPMDIIDAGFGAAGDFFHRTLPAGLLTDMFIDGIWAGLGGIVIFVPQIAILFLFISILEDSGYMSRVVFLMDRIVRPFGMSGKSVIPLIGGMACAVPSIMMARSISHRTERFITIMVTPLMSCSARIPVYVLLISMFVPEDSSWLIFNVQGLILTGMYLLGFFMALLVGWVIKVISKYKSTGMFITEIPVYRVPRWRNTALVMYQKSRTFVVEAGKVIMVISILLWILQTYGPSEKMQAINDTYTAQIAAAGDDADAVAELEISRDSELLKTSYAGWIGQAIEPVIKPLGFDWKIGISLLTSFAAREVFVGTMATLYSAGPDAAEDEDGKFKRLRARMAAERDPDTGKPIYTTAVAISLLLFYAFAMQCMSTLAVVRKETHSWSMTLIMLAYMTGLAYLSSFVAYQVLA